MLEFNSRENKVQNWIVGICCTESDGVNLYRVNGTKEQVKKYLIDCVREDKQNDEDSWDYGDEDIAEIREERDGSMSAFATYSDYHIDYTAIPESKAEIEYLKE